TLLPDTLVYFKGLPTIGFGVFMFQGLFQHSFFQVDPGDFTLKILFYHQGSDMPGIPTSKIPVFYIYRYGYFWVVYGSKGHKNGIVRQLGPDPIYSSEIFYRSRFTRNFQILDL